MRSFIFLSVPALLLWTTHAFAANTLAVGPGKTYAAPCAAFAAAADGDTVEIDASGTYNGDVCAVSRNNLTIRGVNGRPKIDAQGANFGDKAIWVVTGHDVTIDNVEMTGCVDSASNGAAIRQEGTNLTLTHSFIHDNQDGILTVDDATSTVTIENCEFSKNGAGDGQSHNLYINHVGHFVFRFNYSHDAKVGHLLKSRALNNVIAYNHFSDGDGDASYEASMPNGGTSYVIGNIIEQSENTGNSAMIDFASEQTGLNPATDLYVVNNTLINKRTNGAVFVSVGTFATAKAQIINNIFNGTGTVTQQDGAVQTTNYTGADPKFVSATDFHLQEGSPCENAGTAPGAGNGMSLTPILSYVDPEGSIGRQIAGSAIDIGAYEVGGDVALPAGGTSSSSSTGGTGSNGGVSTNPSGSSSGGTDGGAGSGTNGAAPGTTDDSGCSCHTTKSAPTSAALGLVAVVYLLRRRRRPSNQAT